MNILYQIENMGFKVTWKLIDIGLYGTKEMPVQLTREELFNYLDGCLNILNEQTNDIVSLIIEREEAVKTDNILHELANNDHSNMIIQLRKWRAYLLNHLLNNINPDYLQGLLEMMEFWVSMKAFKDCPHIFPNKLSVKNYFNQTMYDILIKKNQTWLVQEISSIIKEENGVIKAINDVEYNS